MERDQRVVLSTAVLNIGRLSPGAADYDLGKVASSTEEYYTGHGERPGRLVGSLATDLGLDGPVAPEQLLTAAHHHGLQVSPVLTLTGAVRGNAVASKVPRCRRSRSSVTTRLRTSTDPDPACPGG